MLQNDIIQRLKNKLDLSDMPKKSGAIFTYLKDIASLLMNECVISKGNASYEIIEIEFYLFTPDYPDVITYPRNCTAGQWFFHQSGVDLTFKTTSNQFGGILIRGLREVGENGKQIFGPLNCAYRLWDVFNGLERVPSEYPVLQAHIFSTFEEPSAFTRWIPLKPEKVKEAGNEQEAKKIFIRSLLKQNRKLLMEGIDNEIYNDIEVNAAVETVFDSRIRFFKIGAINSGDKSWLKYAAKPKTQIDK